VYQWQTKDLAENKCATHTALGTIKLKIKKLAAQEKVQRGEELADVVVGHCGWQSQLMVT
jgi:hypothetical protein